MVPRTVFRYGGVLAAVLLQILFLSSPASGQATTVTGQVLDAGTGAPIPAVTVVVADRYTVTDSNGRFTLRDVPEGAEVVFRRLGYREVAMPTSAGVMQVRLDPLPVLMEALHVNAPRGELLATGTSLAVEEVERRELVASGGTGVAEALDGTQGVSLSRVGSWGSRAVLRGLSGERVAVLIDGNRVSRACTFGMDQGLATVDPATVERVEVLSGPGSALYGSGNVGGVINVVTRRPQDRGRLSGEVRLSGSTAIPGGGVGVSLDGRIGELALAGSVDGSGFDDYDSAAGTVEGSSYRQLTADLKGEWTPHPAHRLSLKGQYYAGRDIGWPMQGGAEIPEETRTSVSADWGWQRGGDLVDGVSARAYFQKLDHHMVMSMIMSGADGMAMTSLTDATSFSETSGGRAQLRLLPLGGLQVETGAEVTHLLAEGTRWTERQMGMADPTEITFRTWPGVTVLDVGAFAQGEMALGTDLSLTAGFRMDRVRREADTGAAKTEWIPTGNAGLRLALTDNLGLRTSVGAGYRTPDPMELYGLALRPDGFVYRGSAELDTERSLNTEVSLSFVQEGFSASVTGFRNGLDELVVPTLTTDTVAGRPVREYRNLGESTLQGVTGQLSTPLGHGVSLQGELTWVHGEDRLSGDPLPMTPPLEGGVALRRGFDGALRWLEVEWTAATEQDRVSVRAGELASPGWAVTHIRTGLEVAGTSLTAGVENVFDRLYRGHLDPWTLHRPGRNIFLRVSRTF